MNVLRLAGLLSQYIAENDEEAKAKLTPSYLGHVLSVNEELYREAIHMQKQQDDHDGHKYAFWLTGEAVAANALPGAMDPSRLGLPPSLDDFEDVLSSGVLAAASPVFPSNQSRIWQESVDSTENSLIEGPQSAGTRLATLR